MNSIICCTICFEELNYEKRGTLEDCAHEFCFKCICEWSKVQQSCPICRKKFTKINGIPVILLTNQERIFLNLINQQLQNELPSESSDDDVRIDETFRSDFSVETSDDQDETVESPNGSIINDTVDVLLDISDGISVSINDEEYDEEYDEEADDADNSDDFRENMSSSGEENVSEYQDISEISNVSDVAHASVISSDSEEEQLIIFDDTIQNQNESSISNDSDVSYMSDISDISNISAGSEVAHNIVIENQSVVDLTDTTYFGESDVDENSDNDLNENFYYESSDELPEEFLDDFSDHNTLNENIFIDHDEDSFEDY